MKVLITGSLGNIGSALKSKLEQDGHVVYGCDLFHTNENYHINISDQDRYMRCDIGEARQLIELLDWAQPDIVYNCAAEFGRWNGEAYYEQLWQTNVIGLKHILTEQRKRKFKLIHFSSSEVYGDWPRVMHESVMDKYEIRQLNDYAISKWTNELQIKNHIITDKTETVIVRLFNTYGPGEKYHPFRSVNCLFTYRLLHNKPVTVYRGHKRTSTYLLDAINTLSNIVNNWLPGSIYNISSNSLHTIEELVELIRIATGADASLIKMLDSEPMTTKYKLVDNTKARQELHHIDSVTLTQGVYNTVQWMKKYYNI